MCDCCGKKTGQENDWGLRAQASHHDHHKTGDKPAGPVFTIVEPAPRKDAEPGK